MNDVDVCWHWKSFSFIVCSVLQDLESFFGSVNFVNWVAAIALWFRLCLPSCSPGFWSKHTIYAFFNLFWKCNEKRTKINKKEAGICPFFKKNKTNNPQKIISFFTLFSFHHVRVLGPEHGQEGGQDVAEGRRRHQVRNSSNTSGKFDVAEATVPGCQHDPEVAEERDLQLWVSDVPQHNCRKNLQWPGEGQRHTN